jgi:ribosomal protein S27E
MPIEVKCNCGRLFVAPESLAGKKVECLGCGRIVAIGAPVASVRTLSVAKPSHPKSSMIEVRCACGQEFMAGEELAGKRVKCRACGKVLDVPSGGRSQSRQPAQQFAAALQPAAVPAYAGGPPPSSYGSLPPFRRKRSSFLPVLLIVGSIGLVGLGGLVVTAVFVADAIRGSMAQSVGSQLASPALPNADSRPAPRYGQPSRASAPLTGSPISAAASPPAQVTDEGYMAATEKFVGRLEQFADQLAAVRDLESAAAIEIRKHEIHNELISSQTELGIQSTRASAAARERCQDDYFPRIEAAFQRIHAENARINEMLYQERLRRPEKVPAWGANGPPRP